jgi:Arc/MetJ-type ribon-helix-helix transcriptional regulator
MDMRRATVTIPDDLEKELQAWLDAQPARPSLAKVLQAALRLYLAEKKLEALEYRPATGPFRFTVDEVGSGHRNVSVEHDAHFAGDA